PVESDRTEEVDAAGEEREAARENPDDRVGNRVEPDGPSDDLAIRAEAASPELVAQDDGLRSVRAVVRFHEGAPARRPGAERREESGRHVADAEHLPPAPG